MKDIWNGIFSPSLMRLFRDQHLVGDRTYVIEVVSGFILYSGGCCMYVSPMLLP